MAKNTAKIARRQFGGRHLLFGEYLRGLDKSKRTLSNYFEWIIKQLMNSAFVGFNTLLDLLNSSHPTQLHSLIAN